MQANHIQEYDNHHFIYSLFLLFKQVDRYLSYIHSLLSQQPQTKSSTVTFIGKQQRLRSDYDLVKDSVKAGLSVMFALGFWMISNWPGGINGIISSVVISLRKNLFEMRTASIQRLCGCLLGGGIALGALFFLEMNFYDLIMILFFLVWGFTYFMFKVPKYSYIGLQANVALIITLAQEGGPPVLLDPPLQRLGGIVIGIVASFLMFNVLWRSDVWTTLGRYLDKLYAYITFNLSQLLLTEANSIITLYEVASTFWLTRELLESLESKFLNKNKQTLLNSLRARFESLVIMQATLSYIIGCIDRQQATETATKIKVSLTEIEEKMVDICTNKDVFAAEQLAEQIKNTLASMEKKLLSSISDAEWGNLLAYLNALLRYLTLM